MNVLRPRIIIGLVIATIALAVVAGTVFWFQQWRTSPLPIDTTLILDVRTGDTLNHISQRMNEQGVELHPRLLRLLAELDSGARFIKAGEYQLEPGTTPRALLRKLVDGRVLLHDVRVPEGFGVRELLVHLKSLNVLQADITALDAPALMQELPQLNQVFEGLESLDSAEGLFLPETFRFPRGTSISEVLLRAARDMNLALNTAWSNRGADLQVTSPYELLILASIIEKETALEADRVQVSQVFHSRLRLNMRLQTDPTVIYALGDAFDGDIRRRDLRVDSPFNTYRVKGLPPTPIAMPSLASIKAAAHPAVGNYLYFVASEQGKSVFSRTLEEHNKAVRKYQLRSR